MASTLARDDVEVRMLEKTRAFRNVDRGASMRPWGAREAQELDVFDVLRRASR